MVKARECNYLVWKDIGRPRTGDVHDDMRVSGLRSNMYFASVAPMKR